MTNKALEYAEVTLGVHKVYEEAQQAYASLESTLEELCEARDNKRKFEHGMADREQEIIQHEWMTHPEMAQTRMDKHIKTAFHNDAGWREFRHLLACSLSTIDRLEADQRLCEADVRIAVSRLHELGGYLNYLAAVKQAASTNETAKTGEAQ